MKLIPNGQFAVDMFIEFGQKRSLALDAGNSNVANRHYKSLWKAVSFLKNTDSLDLLIPLLDHDNVGVRLEAAGYLLPAKKAVDCLMEISCGYGWAAATASTLLDLWKKGEFTPYYGPEE